MDMNLPANLGNTGWISGLGSFTCYGATKPMCSRAHVPQQMKSNPLSGNQRKTLHSNEDPVQPKTNKTFLKRGTRELMKVYFFLNLIIILGWHFHQVSLI